MIILTKDTKSLIVPKGIGDGQLYPGEGGGASFPDAPKDGNTYGRKDGSWSKIEGAGGGIEEAPEDGSTYGRNTGKWEKIEVPEIDAYTKAEADDKFALKGEGGSVEVVQETGSSTSAVMSQSAVTKELEDTVRLSDFDNEKPYAIYKNFQGILQPYQLYVKSRNGGEFLVDANGYSTGGESFMYYNWKYENSEPYYNWQLQYTSSSNALHRGKILSYYEVPHYNEQGTKDGEDHYYSGTLSRDGEIYFGLWKKPWNDIWKQTVKFGKVMLDTEDFKIYLQTPLSEQEAGFTGTHSVKVKDLFNSQKTVGIEFYAKKRSTGVWAHKYTPIYSFLDYHFGTTSAENYYFVKCIYMDEAFRYEILIKEGYDTGDKTWEITSKTPL